MPIRIENIKINRNGPLREDFLFKPGDVNLIFGHNETGKTYIVESIIRLLFKTGTKSSVDWDLRGWDYGGNVSVSGLEDKAISFTKTGKKIDDYWEGQIGLPTDFSRLLVIKGGETQLLAHEQDGVGRDILKSYLSGEGLLDEIGSRISTTLQKSNIEDGQIVGSNMGEIKKRSDLVQKLDELDQLMREAEEVYASSEANDLIEKKKVAESQLEDLTKAKRYYAACLNNEINSYKDQEQKLPSEEQLSQIESNISVYEDREKEAEIKLEEYERLERTSENFRWAEKALNIYREITSGQATTGPKLTYIALALLFVIGAAVSGFLDNNITLAVFGIGAIAFSVLYVLAVRRAFARAGGIQELDRLKKEFVSRYGSELTDRALLEAYLDQLREDHYQAINLKKELDETLSPNLKTLENTIRRAFLQFNGSEPQQPEWRNIVNELRNELRNLETNLKLKEFELNSLEVKDTDFLNEDPGIEWNPDNYEQCLNELNGVIEDLNREYQKLEQVRVRIAQETRRIDSTDWEELITALREIREEATEEYKNITAEILAKIQVSSVIKEYREEENTRIATGLDNANLTKPLHSLTGHYNGVRYEAGTGLLLTTDDDEEYKLSQISSGAKEQVFLALRMGFSSIMMQGETAFLILDDAFQHSDWPRRTNMIGEILNLINTGWQIFYFAMDDHIRDSFVKVGTKLGDRFRSIELSA